MYFWCEVGERCLGWIAYERVSIYAMYEDMVEDKEMSLTCTFTVRFVQRAGICYFIVFTIFNRHR